VGYLAKLDLTGELVDETWFSEKFPAALSILENDENCIALLSYVKVSEEGFGLVKIGESGKIFDESLFEIAYFELHSFTRIDSGRFLVVGKNLTTTLEDRPSGCL